MLIALASGASATASTQVGETFAPTTPCGSIATFLQAQSPAGQYAVPSDGVITSWSYQAALAPAVAPTLKFKVARPQGGTVYTVIGESGAEAMAAGALNVFPARIPVRAGDLIGFHDAVDGSCRRLGVGMGYGVRSAPGDVPPNASADFSSSDPNSNSQLDLAAILEPDCDGDGFGDETQDPAVDCVVPDTVITSAPPPRTRRRKATFDFTSDDSGASFQCRLDGSQFFGCGSPIRLLKVKKGTHSFQVRARDAAGNVDPQPATATWLVKKKKKRRK